MVPVVVLRAGVPVSVAVDEVDVLERVSVYRYILKVYLYIQDMDNMADKVAKVEVGWRACDCLGVGWGVRWVVGWLVSALLPPRLPPCVTPRWWLRPQAGLPLPGEQGTAGWRRCSAV